MQTQTIVRKSLSDVTTQPIKPSDDIISLHLSASNLRERFAMTDYVFSDADGVLVPEGATIMPAPHAEFITQLAACGVGVTMVTGKPLAEVSRIASTLPAGSPLRFLCEKGAYSVKLAENGKLEKTFVLGSAEHESAVADLREAFFSAQASKIIEDTRSESGEQRVWFGLSGSGDHRSILSIDIYGSEPPSNYTELVGAKRDALKLHDEELLTEVETMIEEWVKVIHPDWRVIHLGNANTDIAPGPIEKDLAILKTLEYQQARTVQVWGDTTNDLAMFRLREQHDKVIAGLVLHREKGKALLSDVDFASYGMANTDPFFRLLLATHDA